jgi:predicted small lipoprotein YifL
MARIIRAVAAAAVLAVLIAGCGGSGPDKAACKAALKAEYAAALANGTQGTEPAACKGLSDAELQKLAGEVLSGQ